MASIDSQQLPDAMDVSATLPAPWLKDFADAVIDPDQVTGATQVLVGAYTGKAVDDRIILFFNGDNHSTFAYLMVHSDNLDQDIAFTIDKTPFIDGNSSVEVYYLVQRATGRSDSSEVLAVTIQKRSYLVREFVDFEDRQLHGWEGHGHGASITQYGGSYVAVSGAPGSGGSERGIRKVFTTLKPGASYRVTAKIAGVPLWPAPGISGRFESAAGRFAYGPISAQLTLVTGTFTARSPDTLIIYATSAEVMQTVWVDDVLIELID